MEIKVKIEAPELASALSDIAIALSAMANLSGGTVLHSTVEESTTPPADEKKKPVDIQKEKIAEEIIALGGTPPEKGSVAKFEAMLEEAKKAAEEATDEATDEEDAANRLPGETTEEAEEVSLDDVRTLAHVVIKPTPDNPVKGKSALGGMLKLVKAERISTCSQKQLVKLVTMLEEYIGKTLAEVLAEAE